MKHKVQFFAFLILLLSGFFSAFSQEQFKYILDKGTKKISAHKDNKSSVPKETDLIIILETDDNTITTLKYKNAKEETVAVQADPAKNWTITKDKLGSLTSFDFEFFDNKDKKVGDTNKIVISHLDKKTGGGTPGKIKLKSDILNNFKSQPSFIEPYDDRANQVYLYFDENGKLLNSLPVNVDQNDKFHMYIVAQKGYENNYNVKVVEGLYEPADLNIVPHPAPGEDKITQQSKTGEPLLEYVKKEIIVGPFTSDHFKFQITYDDTTKKMHSEVYSLKINKLYHVGVGVSLINTNLFNPDFKTVAGATDTTIKAFNNGSRTLVTFNAIWYWSVLQQNRKGSVITSGRDILKDEPTFSLHRVFPTFGISIDKNFRENFFAGLVYEFARGGSLIGGIHYGRVKQLSDRSYVLGETPFHGTDADIKIDNVYKSSFFFGINLDTRIFNLLIGRQ